MTGDWTPVKSPGLSLSETLKTKPLKKIPETDAIFEHVAHTNTAADGDPSVLRSSINSKAKVKVGNLSRHGKDRREEAPKTDDHDTEWQQVLVPLAILNMHSDACAMYIGESAETPDFIVDCLEHWWRLNQPHYPHMTTLVIDLDGGSATRSNRTQFMKRRVDFSRHYSVSIQLIYYPPYHNKYNPFAKHAASL